MDVQKQLFALQDKAYAEFQSKLTPTIPRQLFIGVRVPQLRKLAKQYIKNAESLTFMKALPHSYYDENMLHGLLVSEIMEYNTCIEAVDVFLPYVDNWAVCDVMSPKIFKKHKAQLLDKIRQWTASDHVYTCRFGIEMLMTHFLDDDFRQEYLDIPARIRSKEYYVNMMIAWFFATALAKQWNHAACYLREHRMDVWVHNKTIQKACESYRITADRKSYLKGLKR